MLYTIHCTFRPGAYAHAKPVREEHYAFLARRRGDIVEGGPLLGPDGTPQGMLMVVEMPDEEAAATFISEEPYTRHGFFESVAVRRWSHVIPEPTPGFVQNELAKERESHSHSGELSPIN
jgi:uncharacterized protein YciI